MRFPGACQGIDMREKKSMRRVKVINSSEYYSRLSKIAFFERVLRVSILRKKDLGVLMSQQIDEAVKGRASSGHTFRVNMLKRRV